jgi:hypothetical protein
MKRLLCLCAFATALPACVQDGQPSAVLDQLIGASASGGPGSVRQVFATISGLPQVGARVPELGGQLSIRVISESRTAADVTVRFVIGAIEVHLARLHVAPFEIVDAIGPDSTIRAEIAGTYATGRPTPSLALTLGQDFGEGDQKEYIIPDPDDACPDDPNKYEPGACGCGVPDTDSDGDGVPDCADECPNDPSKTASGVCGCGVPEIDTDGDGVPDCADECPNDPNKTAPGVCGCGAPDTDSDGDGTPDCVDECPDDPNKTKPGDCGCGVPEGSCRIPLGFTLAVSISPAGAGTVTRLPDSAPYAAGTTVTLTARASFGHAFDHWEGDAAGTNGSTTVTMNANRSVTAVFTPPAWSVEHIINTSLSICLPDAGSDSPVCVDQVYGARNNRGLAISPDGRFLYLGYGDPGWIVRKVEIGHAPADNATAVKAQLKVDATGGRTWAKSIATDDAGRVYFTQDIEIQVYDADLATRLLTITGFTRTNGVHVVRAGPSRLYLYHTERGATTGQLGRMVLDESAAFGGGSLAWSGDAEFGSGGSVDLGTTATDVRGLATDATGDIWVADRGGTVFRVSSSGALLGSVAVPEAFDVYVDGDHVLVSQDRVATIAVIERTASPLRAVATLSIPFTGLSLIPPPGVSSATLGGIDGRPGRDLFVAVEAGDSITPSPFRPNATDDDDEPVLKMQPAMPP